MSPHPDDEGDHVSDPALDAAVESLLLRRIGTPHHATPLSTDRLIEWMQDCDYSHFVSSDGHVGGIFLGRLFAFVLLGPQKSVLCIRGTWNRDLAIERVEEILELCNDWNAGHLWPKAYARVLDNGVVQVHTEVVADLDHGATPDQLDDILECGLRTGLVFFDALDAHYPDPARQAP